MQENSHVRSLRAVVLPMLIGLALWACGGAPAATEAPPATATPPPAQVQESGPINAPGLTDTPAPTERPATAAPPSLVVFVDGHWRDAGCKTGEDAGLRPPSEIEQVQRVSFIGEAVQLQWDYESPGFELAVLDAPDPVDDITLRLPVLITSTTDRLELDHILIPTSIVTAPDGDGKVMEWITERYEGPCAV